MIVRFKKLLTGDKFTSLSAKLENMQVLCKTTNNKAIDNDGKEYEIDPNEQVYRLKREKKFESSRL